MLTQTNNSNTQGIVIDRDLLKEKMRKAGEKCGSAMLLYYRAAGNASHENKMKYMLTDLLYNKKEEAEFICETIYEEANTHLVFAMKYGYTSEDLANLRNYTDAYRKHLKNQEHVVKSKKKLDSIIQDFSMWRNQEE